MSIVKNENIITKAYYGTKPIYTFGNIEISDCPECPELTELFVTTNGTYKGAYDKVYVSVNCTLLEALKSYVGSTEGFDFYDNYFNSIGDDRDALLCNYNILMENKDTTYGIFSDLYNWDSSPTVLPVPLGKNTKHLDDVLGGTFSPDVVLAVFGDGYRIETTTDAFRNCDFSLTSFDFLGLNFTAEQNFVLPKYTQYNGDCKYTADQIKQFQLRLIDSLYDFSKGPNVHKTGKSSLVIQRGTRGFDDDVIAAAIAKGWLVVKE